MLIRRTTRMFLRAETLSFDDQALSSPLLVAPAAADLLPSSADSSGGYRRPEGDYGQKHS
jgi:hypothetical protein